jgi:acetyl esterase
MRVSSRTKTALCGGVLSAMTAVGADFAPDEVVVYKQPPNGKPLRLHIFRPEESGGRDLPCIVFFFGGGWRGGTAKQFFQQADYFRRRGIVAISADYRTRSSHGTTPQDCVADGKSAIRWVRQDAIELGVDPGKIIAAGGSAGGHVAACTGVIQGFEDPADDLEVSSLPNAMVLFNSVLDTTKAGFGSGAVGPNKTEISPCHHVRPNLPPTLVFHGTADTAVPCENAERFTRLMTEAGNTCKLVTFDGRGHGFFNGPFFRANLDGEDYAATMHEADAWLTGLGLLGGQPLPLESSSLTGRSR